MGSHLPSSSTVLSELRDRYYDLAQLHRAVTTAATSPALSSTSTDTTHLVHLHTLTIQAALLPPPEFDTYVDGLRPNPLVPVFQKLIDTLQVSTEAFIPLTIMPPTTRRLRAPGSSERLPRPPGPKDRESAEIFLPNSHRQKPVLRVPTILPNDGRSWHPTSTAWSTTNWLHAALAVDPDTPQSGKGRAKETVRRFELRTGLQLCWIPNEYDEDAAVELKALITIDVLLDLDKIITPGQPDLVGLILHSLIPSPTGESPMSESEARAANLRHFLTSLRPAPDIPLHVDARTYQPPEMTSRLLPFQRRTVALLLDRERSGPSKSTGTWSFETLAGNQIAYRRVTGDVVKIEHDPKGKGKEVDAESDEALHTLVNLSPVRGMMLCEEMGLGKTVEAIALMLLNKHPLSTPREAEAEDVKPQVAAPSGNVPNIDLRNEPPWLDNKAVMNWAAREQAVFADTRVWDDSAQLYVTQAATTLIVTPPSLLKQWVAEMATHAPSMRVCVYPGWKVLQRDVESAHSAAAKHRNAQLSLKRKRSAKAFREKTRKKYSKNEPSQDDPESEQEEEDEVPDLDSLLDMTQKKFLDYVRAHDVVITTYRTLSDDLKVALPAPSRSRRSTADYRLRERPRSPLVMVEWWRVVMDEVQLQGDLTAAANMVSLIPRKCSLAISGTPARGDVKDLMGSLRFLRVPRLPFDPTLWHRYIQPQMRPAFEGLFRSLAVRTTKAEVAGEFNLPHQNRFVVPIELSPIEMHYYSDTLRRQRERLRLPADPNEPIPEGWQLDSSLFRACLRNLRQICTHFQVGGLGGTLARPERLHLGRELMTTSEALAKIHKDHEQDMILEARTQMRAQIRKAQLMTVGDKEEVAVLNALLLYETIRNAAGKQLETARAQLTSLVGDREGTIDSDEDPVDGEEVVKSQAEREKHLAAQRLRHSVREVQIILHQTWFFEGDIRHVKKEEDLEVLAYQRAEVIRRDILARPLRGTQLSVEQMTRVVERRPAISGIEDLHETNTKHVYGISTVNIVSQVDNLLKILNDNAVLVVGWRTKIINLLKLPVESDENDLPAVGEGQEVENPEAEFYAEALKAQGDVEAYLTAYSAALADRKEMLVEERSILATHDARETKKRTTKAAQEAQVDVIEEPLDAMDELTATLMIERRAFRDQRREKGCQHPLKAYLIDLNNIIYGASRVEEINMAKAVHQDIRKYLHTQGEFIEKLNKELEMFRATFNKRVLYYAALQEISDSVAQPVFKDANREINELSFTIADLEKRLAQMIIKNRYLEYLGSQNQDRDIREDCMICFGTSDDKFALILECGHPFCESCFREYRASGGMGRRCPTCKAEIREKAMTRIKLAHGESTEEAGTEDTAKEKQPLTASSSTVTELNNETQTEAETEEESRAADMSRLKMMDDDRRRSVMLMDMMGDYGSKINFLIKHLVYYRITDPGARHVVFSNWADSLHIVERALTANRIKYVSFDKSQRGHDVVQDFKNDSSITVFLLHAERESSGLTLTSCRVVHLLEPVLQHSFELQAIGRVDRLGQKKETTVYCYATMDTVESRVLSQGVRNGTSIYLKDEDAGERAVASMPNVVSAAHKGGDLSHGGNNEDELLKLIM